MEIPGLPNNTAGNLKQKKVIIDESLFVLKSEVHRELMGVST